MDKTKTTTTEQIVDDVLDLLYDVYFTPEKIQGQSISFVVKELRGKGYRGFDRDYLEYILPGLGFEIVSGKNNRGQSAVVITV